MKEIGGYFELELNRGQEYHHNAIRLNLGRTSFEYILKAKKIQKIFMPYYTCDVMLKSVIRTGINCEFYYIDENLEPVFNFALLTARDYFLYTNYFGIKDRFIKYLAKKITNLIIDNSQAFFTKPIKDIDTFYSPRKFFGVPDGGYLYTRERLDSIFEQDISCERIDHLVLRIDKSAEDGYKAFQKNGKALINQPIKTMSKLTQSLLGNIDYKKSRIKRNENFLFFHDRFHKQNELNFDIAGLYSPMVYPFLCSNGKKNKTKLIENKIFIASYWKNVIRTIDANSFEAYLTNNLIPLPVDQRYSLADLKIILKRIKKIGLSEFI